ncbi:lytic transglycosylase domain-containing protein [Shewanella gelidimarina]|uniref:lytic transglycosylase domain-containing protein n=1 Tax=Shewanella gelidimarina TaxID=56813 RepID=UPI00200C629B|nr:lytic transglycosylase domain-containing protein [Shewanella gelidimarina]MCL1056509.1 lytic transglycosylase domain-containing protein [Shewanella gelidimarina]
MIKALLLCLAAFSVCSWAQTSKPHFVAKPSDKSVLGSQRDSSKSKQVKSAPNQVYHYQNADGVVVFSDRPPETGHYQVRIYDCYACKPSSNINWQSIPLFTQQYNEDIRLAARTYQLEAALIRAVIHAESSFRPAAISKTGAQGLMQLMPATAKELGVTDAFKPSQNIQAGSRYLAQLLKRFDGDITLACAAYNAGASRVEQYRGVPPFPETKAYVERVNILLQRYRKA